MIGVFGLYSPSGLAWCSACDSGHCCSCDHHWRCIRNALDFGTSLGRVSGFMFQNCLAVIDTSWTVSGTGGRDKMISALVVLLSGYLLGWQHGSRLINITAQTHLAFSPHQNPKCRHRLTSQPVQLISIDDPPPLRCSSARSPFAVCDP